MAPNAPEARARERIDLRLVEAGWRVQGRSDMNLGTGPGVAVREFETNAGPADYLLFVDEHAVGVIEAGSDAGGARPRPEPMRRARPGASPPPCRRK